MFFFNLQPNRLNHQLQQANYSWIHSKLPNIRFPARQKPLARMHPHNGGSELTNFWLRWWETAGEAQPADGVWVFCWGEANDLKKMMPRYASVMVATKPMILVWKLWRMLVVALKKVVCRPWTRFQAFGAVYPMVHRFFFWHVCVKYCILKCLIPRCIEIVMAMDDVK